MDLEFSLDKPGDASRAKVVVTANPAGPEDAPISVVAPPSPLVSVNCGGPTDAGFAVSPPSVPWSRLDPIDLSRVPNPFPLAAYQCGRTAPAGGITYRFAGFAPSSALAIELHFVEPVHTTPGNRPMDIIINGLRLDTHLDPFTVAGGKDRAVMVPFGTIADPSGIVAITLLASLGAIDTNVYLCALRVSAAAPAVT